MRPKGLPPPRLEPAQVLAFYPAGDAAEVEYLGGGGDDLLVVEAGVGGDDRDQVGCRYGGVEIDRGEAVLRQLRDEGGVVGNLAAEALQVGDDLQRGRFADVADAALVAGAEDQDPGAVDRFAGAVEGALYPFHAVGGLSLVHFSGQLDELGVEVVLAGLEGEVEGIDREAVASHPRPG